MASRPFVTLNVIDVLTEKLADPVPPTATCIPAGLDVTRSPVRPVAVTVNVALAGELVGLMVRLPIATYAARTGVIVTIVEAATDCVAIVNVALVLPATTITLAGTGATPALLVDSVTIAPPDGAPLINVAVPWTELPPTTVDGSSEIVESFF